jgi:hypothetical protein
VQEGKQESLTDTAIQRSAQKAVHQNTPPLAKHLQKKKPDSFFNKLKKIEQHNRKTSNNLDKNWQKKKETLNCEL